jgi:hypothetical protein
LIIPELIKKLEEKGLFSDLDYFHVVLPLRSRDWRDVEWPSDLRFIA